jgi:hypothetical protein
LALPAPPHRPRPAARAGAEGHHSRETLKSLDDGPWKSRIAGPQRDGFLRRLGDAAARRAVINHRTRLR